MKALWELSMFVICCGMLIHLGPKECYEKYYRMLVHLFALAQILDVLEGWFHR